MIFKGPPKLGTSIFGKFFYSAFIMTLTLSNHWIQCAVLYTSSSLSISHLNRNVKHLYYYTPTSIGEQGRQAGRQSDRQLPKSIDVELPSHRKWWQHCHNNGQHCVKKYECEITKKVKKKTYQIMPVELNGGASISSLSFLLLLLFLSNWQLSQRWLSSSMQYPRAMSC